MRADNGCGLYLELAEYLDVLQVRVAKARWVLQPKTEHAIHADMRDPDHLFAWAPSRAHTRP